MLRRQPSFSQQCIAGQETQTQNKKDQSRYMQIFLNSEDFQAVEQVHKDVLHPPSLQVFKTQLDKALEKPGQAS